MMTETGWRVPVLRGATVLVMATGAMFALAIAGASRSPSESAEVRRSTPIVEIANGTEGAADWALRAHLADVILDGETRDAICIDWVYPAVGQPDDFNCLLDFKEDLAAGGVFGASAYFNDGDAVDPPRSSFFGMTPAETESVEVILAGGEVSSAEVAGPFAEFEGVKFFAAFAPARQEVEIVARNAAGEVLWSDKEAP